MSSVVERILEVARQRSRVSGCPQPQETVLRAVVEYVVDRVRGTRGELMTLPVAPIRRLFPHKWIITPCIVAWLGLQDCVFSFGNGKVILRLSCVREKLGI